MKNNDWNKIIGRFWKIKRYVNKIKVSLIKKYMYFK